MKTVPFSLILLLGLLSNLENVNAQGDTAEPVLNSISISNEKIQAGDDLTFIVNMTDDNSGIYLAFISYSNQYDEQYSGLIGGQLSTEWTDLGDNNYSITTKLNEFARSGEWYIRSVQIKDNADNFLNQNYYSSDQSILTFNVLNENEDTAKPVLNSISISNEKIQAGDDLTFIVNMTDDNSGIYLAFISYSNQYDEQYSGLIGGQLSTEWTDLGNNNYSITTKLNEFARSGEWYIHSVQIKDNADNFLNQNYYPSDQSILTFNVLNENEDTAEPVLNSISISNEKIQAGDDLTFIVNMTDDNSGIYLAFISYGNQYDEQYSGLIGGQLSTEWTDLGDNNYSITTKLDEFARSGEWYIHSVQIKDNADNFLNQNYYPSDQSILTFNVLNENEDTAEPVLNSISISNEKIQAGDDLTFIVNMTDDNSGIYLAFISYSNQYDEQYSGLIGGQLSTEWTDLGDNNYSITTKLNEFARSGEWYIRSVQIKDNADNFLNQNYYPSDQSILTFNVLNENEDTAEPVLNSISISNEKIQAGDDLTFILNMTDDNSGIYDAFISYSNQYDEQYSGLIGGQLSTEWTDLGDNNYSITTKLNEFARSGEWYIHSIQIKDNADNLYSRDYYTSDQSILTFSVGGSTTNSEDMLYDRISITRNNAFLFTINSSIKIIDYGVYDLKGTKCNINKSHEKVINLSSKPRGVYIIRILTTKGYVSKKVIR